MSPTDDLLGDSLRRLAECHRDRAAADVYWAARSQAREFPVDAHGEVGAGGPFRGGGPAEARAARGAVVVLALALAAGAVVLTGRMVASLRGSDRDRSVPVAAQPPDLVDSSTTGTQQCRLGAGCAVPRHPRDLVLTSVPRGFSPQPKRVEQPVGFELWYRPVTADTARRGNPAPRELVVRFIRDAATSDAEWQMFDQEKEGVLGRYPMRISERGADARAGGMLSHLMVRLDDGASIHAIGPGLTAAQLQAILGSAVLAP